MKHHYHFMHRCIKLSREAASQGDLPIAAIIAREEKIIVEVLNKAVVEYDITRHAELLAVSEAQRKLGTHDLSGCTLYTTVEPCVMCSFAIREARIKCVVYAVRSPMMGGINRWNIMKDEILWRTLPEDFGPPPKIIQILTEEAEAAWHERDPMKWEKLKQSAFF